jgi:hypothetical protein
MRDLADYKCYLTCRLEIAKSFLKQQVTPGTPEEAEQWMVKGRLLEIEKLLEKLSQVRDGCLDEGHS